MNAKDARDFFAYLRACTDRQVIGVHAKERAAGRDDYAELAAQEAARRGLDIDDRETPEPGDARYYRPPGAADR